MVQRRLLPIVTSGLLTAGLVACGDADVATEITAGTVANVGQLPDLQTGRGADGRPLDAAALIPPTSPSDPEGTEPDETSPRTTEPEDTAPDDTEPDDTEPDDTATTPPGDTIPGLEGVVGEGAGGNRVLALGDSITAAIGPQFGGQLCDVLEGQGWFLGVDAFQGRPIESGLSVLRSDIDLDEWDAAIVNLGSNYRGDADDYAADLRAILTELAPRPVLVVTVTQFEETIAEVNYVIRDVASDRDDVWVAEWSERTRTDDELTGADGLHLSDAGRAALAEMLAEAMGEAPRAGEAEAEPGCEALRDADQESSDNSGDGDTTNADTGDGGRDDGGG